MANKVQLYRSDDAGAPQLTNAMGSLIALFDACLVNGYNAKTGAAITTVTSIGDVATITFAAPHYFRELQRLEVVLPDAQYSGVFDIVSVALNSLTVKLSETPTSATCTPDLVSSVKVAAAKWVKEYSETNKAAYRPALNTSNRCFLSVDDSLPITGGIANVRGYETMSGATVGNNPIQTVLKQPVASHNIPKSSDTTAKSWILSADGDMFYFFVNPTTQANYGYFGFAFGYAKTKMTLDDTFGCLILASNGAAASSWSNGFRTSMLVNVPTTPAVAGYFARSFSQIGGSTPFCLFGSGNTGTFGNGVEPFPSPIDNSLNVSPVYVYQGGTRSVLNGILQPIHNKPLGHGSYYKGLAEFPNQTVLAIGLSDGVNQAVNGELHLIVEGLW